ncbi:spermatogenesis associated protein 5 [Bulinus truncatus]|nr:spermatogenesis associated protein 5 [Bulinus truncatus]
MMAKALANEFKINLIFVKDPFLLHRYPDESEAVRDIFRKARLAAPAMLFFDDLDMYAPMGGSFLTQMFKEMDQKTFSKIIILAASNRPNVLDVALLKPGRLSFTFYIPLPDTDTRREILQKKLAQMIISADVQVDWLLEMTSHFSSYEVINLCNIAGALALREDADALMVDKNHFKLALNRIQPKTDQTLLKMYADFHDKFG